MIYVFYIDVCCRSTDLARTSFATHHPVTRRAARSRSAMLAITCPRLSIVQPSGQARLAKYFWSLPHPTVGSCRVASHVRKTKAEMLRVPLQRCLPQTAQPLIEHEKIFSSNPTKHGPRHSVTLQRPLGLEHSPTRSPAQT